MSTLNFPWDRPTGDYSHYFDDGPPVPITFAPWPGHDILFTVEPTNEMGFHTGRTRYHVECKACPAHEAVVHPATTGPAQMIEMHLEREHGWNSH